MHKARLIVNKKYDSFRGMVFIFGFDDI